VDRNCTMDRARRWESCWGIAEQAEPRIRATLEGRQAQISKFSPQRLSGWFSSPIATGFYRSATMLGGNNKKRKYVDLIFKSRRCRDDGGRDE
jgi:hypothetical protein